MLKQIVVKYDCPEQPERNSQEIYVPNLKSSHWKSQHGIEMNTACKMIVMWLISAGGLKLTVQFDGYELSIEPVYELRNEKK